MAGIRYPVARTRAAWEKCVAVPPGVLCQDESGRLWDVLWMLCCAITRQKGGRVVPFALHVRNDNRERTPPLVNLMALCGPGDGGEPVVTVMLPDEDTDRATGKRQFRRGSCSRAESCLTQVHP